MEDSQYLSDEYQCPHCRVISEDYEWNDTTKAEFGPDIVMLPCTNPEELTYVCPHCEGYVAGEELIIKRVK